VQSSSIGYSTVWGFKKISSSMGTNGREGRVAHRKEEERSRLGKSPEPNHGDHARSLFIGSKMGHLLLFWCRLAGSRVMNELN
jgi:hypothetical protein